MMSGTSLDGVDAALVETDGVVARPLRSAFLPYSAAEQSVLRGALGLWPGEEGAAALAEASAVVEGRHAALAATFPEADLVGFHGQTLAHAPAAWRTHQLGDGAALARRLGRPVVWDFRTADVLSGGEGAPLVPVYHFAVAQAAGATGPLAILNLGGVGNVTWIDPNAAGPEAPGALLAFDTGPGNALMNDLVAARLNRPFDAEGALAGAGRVAEPLVARALSDPYFARPAPKSLDRDAFQGWLDWLAPLSTEDALATLAAITVESVVAARAQMPEPPETWWVAGGGRQNRTVMAGLAARANRPVLPIEGVGRDGDMLEAEAFAHLAVRVLRGHPTSFPKTTGARLPVSGGRISQP